MIPVVVGSNPIIHPSSSHVAGDTTVHGPLAQLVEQLTLNQLVEGSNPSRPTKRQNADRKTVGVLFCAFRWGECKQGGGRDRRTQPEWSQVVASDDGSFALASESSQVALVLRGRATVK